MNILTIMFSTFKELTRNKIFYVTVFFFVIVTLCALFHRTLTISEEIKLMKDIGLAAITVLGMLMAIFTGANVVSKEIDKKTAQVLLAKPVAKYEFILGKFLGALITVLVNIALMTLGFLLLVAIKENIFYVAVLKMIPLICFEMAILTAVALMLSIVLSSTVASIFSFCIFILGHTIYLLPYFIEKAENVIVKVIGGLFYYLLPNLEYFNIKSQVAYNQYIPWSVIGLSSAYGLVYCLAILVLSTLAFRAKELA